MVVGGIAGLGYAAIPKLSIAVVVDGIIPGPSSPADPLNLGVPALEQAESCLLEVLEASHALFGTGGHMLMGSIKSGFRSAGSWCVKADMASVKLKLRQWLVSLDRAAMMGFGRAYLEFSSPSGIDRSGSGRSKEPYVPAKLSGFHPEFVPVNGMEG